MNLDERLAALTDTVELLAAFHRDNEKRFEQNEKRAEQNEKRAEQKEKRAEENEKRLERLMQAIQVVAGRNNRLEDLVTKIAEGTARILHVVEVHERRISQLEAGSSSL
jgi:predicted ribosome quality control (RQC) complex YloA/Tae2 family protein